LLYNRSRIRPYPYLVDPDPGGPKNIQIRKWAGVDKKRQFSSRMEENLWPFQQNKEDISITMEIRKSFSLVMARGDGSKVGTSRATEEAQFISRSEHQNWIKVLLKEVRGTAALTLGSAYIKPF
jgi:hypothetical protein